MIPLLLLKCHGYPTEGPLAKWTYLIMSRLGILWGHLTGAVMNLPGLLQKLWKYKLEKSPESEAIFVPLSSISKIVYCRRLTIFSNNSFASEADLCGITSDFKFLLINRSLIFACTSCLKNPEKNIGFVVTQLYYLGKVLKYKSRGELSLLVQSTIQCVFLKLFWPNKVCTTLLSKN